MRNKHCILCETTPPRPNAGLGFKRTNAAGWAIETKKQFLSQNLWRESNKKCYLTRLIVKYSQELSDSSISSYVEVSPESHQANIFFEHRMGTEYTARHQPVNL